MRFLLCLSLAVVFNIPSARAQQLAIVHAQIIDVATGTIQPDQTVVIVGKRITRVGPSSPTNPPGRVINARGQYLIPGLWDMHTHVYFGGTTAAGSDLILPLLLAYGVTGIRDMGSNLDSILYAREAVAAHKLVGPRLVVSGPMLDGGKSAYQAMIPIATALEGRDAVDMLKRRGVDFIKVQSLLPREAYLAIADEARKVGLSLEGHVPDNVRATEAIAAGQRTFEHLIGLFEASSTDEEIYVAGGTKSPGRYLATYDPTREATFIKLLTTKQVWQCPTLFWERGQWLVDAIDWRKDPALVYAGRSWVTKLWPKAQLSIAQTMDTEPLPVREKFVNHELDIVRKLHTAGVRFLAGTDTPAGVDVMPGISLHEELQRFVDAGFTPLQALQTATLNPAKFYNRLADFGSVEPGRLADLVLLNANPLTNIANTQQIAGVIADGQYRSRRDLDQLLNRLKQVAAEK